MKSFHKHLLTRLRKNEKRSANLREGKIIHHRDILQNYWSVLRLPEKTFIPIWSNLFISHIMLQNGDPSFNFFCPPWN